MACGERTHQGAGRKKPWRALVVEDGKPATGGHLGAENAEAWKALAGLFRARCTERASQASATQERAGG